MSSNVRNIIESIQQLPASERETVRLWLEDRRASNGDHELAQDGGSAANSLRWLAENREQYLGQWVALEGDRLIASGKTAKEVYAVAKAEGVKIPFVELVAETEPSPYTGGWLS